MSKKKRQQLSDEELIKRLGIRIRKLRESTGVSQETFAYQHDLNRGQYGRHERGMDMRITSIHKICVALGITLADLFAEGFDD